MTQTRRPLRLTAAALLMSVVSACGGNSDKAELAAPSPDPASPSASEEARPASSSAGKPTTNGTATSTGATTPTLAVTEGARLEVTRLQPDDGSGLATVRGNVRVVLAPCFDAVSRSDGAPCLGSTPGTGRVTLVNNPPGESQTAILNGSGDFFVDRVTPGQYTLRVFGPKPFSQSINVQAGIIRVRVALRE